MKTKIILETLVLAAALMATQAGAAPISLQGSTVTATYKGSAEGMLGLDHWFAQEPGSNTTAIDPNDDPVNQEFITSDFLFMFDFSTTGRLAVTLNLDDPANLPAGDYRASFDFGASLVQRIGSFTLLDTNAIGSLPGLSVVNEHTIAIDLSSVTWNGAFSTFSAQIGETAAVPEPGSIGLVLAGVAGLAMGRRRRGAAPGQR